MCVVVDYGEIRVMIEYKFVSEERVGCEIDRFERGDDVRREHGFTVVMMKFDDIVVDENQRKVKWMGSQCGRLLH